MPFNASKTTQKIRFLFFLTSLLVGLAYFYWWLTRPNEKQFSALEIETFSSTKTPPPRKPDDLAKIKGIGPKISDALFSQGVLTFDQLALMSEEDLRKLLSKAGIRIANTSTWAKQASLAALEQWEELDEFQAAI